MSLRLPLLALLADGPRSATHLRQRITALNGGEAAGDVDDILAALERERLVDSPASEYRLTDAGRAAVDDWWSTAVAPNRSGELLIKVGLALEDPDHELIPVLDRQRRSTLDALRELILTSRDLSDGPSLERLRIERRIFDIESELRWLDRVEALADPSSPGA